MVIFNLRGTANSDPNISARDDYSLSWAPRTLHGQVLVGCTLEFLPSKNMTILQK